MDWFNNPSYLVQINGNKIVGNSQTYGWSLCKGGVEVVEASMNANDGTTDLFGYNGMKGPIIAIRNKCVMTPSTDYNLQANLSINFTPNIGEKIPYMLPVAGGSEGIVYTSAGWKTYGSIAS